VGRQTPNASFRLTITSIAITVDMSYQSTSRGVYFRASSQATAIFSSAVRACIIDYMGSIGIVAQMPEPTTARDRRSVREAYQTCFAWLTRPRDSQELLQLSQAQCTCNSGALLALSHQAGLKIIELFGGPSWQLFFVLADYILALFLVRLDANPMTEDQETRQRVHHMLHRRTWPGTWQEMLPHGPKDTMFALLRLFDTNPPIRLRYSTITVIGRIARYCHPLVVPIFIHSSGMMVSSIMVSISQSQQILIEQLGSESPDVKVLVGTQNCLTSIAVFLLGLFKFSHETQRTIFHVEVGSYLLNAYSDAALLCQTLAENNRFLLSESVIARNSEILGKFGLLGGFIYHDWPNSRKQDIDAVLVELFDKNSSRHLALKGRTWLRLLQLFQHLEVRQQCAAPGCLYTLVDGPLWRCAGCVRVVYCSRACQKRAWRHDIPHRSVCSVLARLQKELQLPHDNVYPEEPRASVAWLPLANATLDYFVRLVVYNMK
jgi:hypothetical protein